jgi:predicted Zn-dependent protease
MGESYAREVETNSKLITDPAILDYVNRVGQNVARHSDSQLRFTIKIVETDRVNAFSLPGGFLFVDSGLILAADNEAELAGALSHEIAHVAACHAAQELARQQLTSVASMPLILRLVLRPITRNTSYSTPNRRAEPEADLLAVEYLYKAGYDPQALPSFLEKLKARGEQKPGSLGIDFESHPQTAERIERTQQQIKKLLPPAPEYTVDTSDFQEIKARLFELESRRKEDKNHLGDDSHLTRAAVAAGP